MTVIEPPFREAARRLLVDAGLSATARLTPVESGNNRVFRVDDGDRRAVLKHYFSHPDDRRPRLDAEVAFCRLLWRRGVRCIPRLLGADRQHDVALFSHLPGAPVPPAAVDGDAVDQALAFVAAINRARTADDAADAGALADASEACFALDAHLQLVDIRLARLMAMEPASTTHEHAISFVAKELFPAWQRIRGAATRQADDLGIEGGGELAAADRCLSPSDFGFHNALRGDDGRLGFLDFEYAGWDDPAKLVGDFFSQVAVPVPDRHYPRFADAIATLTADPPWHRARFDLLLPVYRVKWVCIVLNDFLPVAAARRRFSEADERGVEQLARARALLSRPAVGAR